MFTGLVLERGRVAASESLTELGGVRLQVEASTTLCGRLDIGASLAVSGCCLTVTAFGDPDSGSGGLIEMELSPETLQRTTLGSLVTGDEVNLEPALAMGEPLGGHWVQGHVDGTTELLERIDHEEFSTFWWRVPQGLEASFVEKGSVTVDGVSLTVAELASDGDGERFSVALIPHTLDVTTLGARVAGTQFNIEVDVLSKYVEKAVERALAARASA